MTDAPAPSATPTPTPIATPTATAPIPHLTWAKGGHAEIVKLEGDLIALRSTTSSPPGQRLEAMLDIEPRTAVKLKSHGTHKEADGSFLLKGRLIDATRPLRDRLAALIR